MDRENWPDRDRQVVSAAQDFNRMRERRLLQLAVLVSLALHGGLAAVLLRGGYATSPALQSHSPLQSVRINLLPKNPQRRAPVESNPESDPGIAAEPELSQALAETAPEPEVENPPVQPQLPPTQGSDRTEAPRPHSEALDIPRPAITLPSVDVVRSSVRQLDDARRSQLWLRDCNPRQEENELLDCESERQVDYSTALENPTYSALQPRRELTRSERSLSTITDNRDALAARLANADLPGGLMDYVLQEMEAGISLGSDSGNRTVEHMIRMTDKSAAAEQARRVLGDAWIQTRSQELQRRKIIEQ